MFGFLCNLQDAGCFLGSLVLTLTCFSERKLLIMPCCMRKSFNFRAYGRLTVRFRLTGSFRSKCRLQPLQYLSFTNGNSVCLNYYSGRFRGLPR
jgi:hypothetical protein